MLGFIDAMRTLYKGFRIPDAVLTTDLSTVKAFVNEHANQIGANKTIPEYALDQLAAGQVFENPEQAITTLLYALDLYTNSLAMRNMLIDAYVNSGEFEKAKIAKDEAIKLAQEIDPSYVEIFQGKNIDKD